MSEQVTAAEILRRLVSPTHLDLAETVSAKTGQSLLLVLLDLELVDGERLAAELAQALELERFSPECTPREASALYTIDRDFARDHSCFPVAFDMGHLVLAMVDPLDSATTETVEQAVGYPVRPLVATRHELEQAFSGWSEDSEELAATAEAAGNAPPLAIPTAVFVGYPDGVGVTSLIWNLAYAIGRKSAVLLVSIGGPPEHTNDLRSLSLVGAHLTVVAEASLVPDRLADLSERADAGDAPRFDIALVEIDRPAFAVDAQQVAVWARSLILVTDSEHAGESWDLIRSMYGGGRAGHPISVGVVLNKTRSPELAEVGLATLEAAVRSSELGESVRLWSAGSLPYAHEAVHRAEAEGKLIVEAFPRHPLAKELREVARRLVATVTGKE